MIDPQHGRVHPESEGTPIDPLTASMLKCRAAAHAVGVAHAELEAADAVQRAAADRKVAALTAYRDAWDAHRRLVESGSGWGDRS